MTELLTEAALGLVALLAGWRLWAGLRRWGNWGEVKAEVGEAFALGGGCGLFERRE